MKNQYHCCVPECGNKAPFSFPSSSLYRKMWIEKFKACKPDNWKPASKDKLCCAHFKKSDVLDVKDWQGTKKYEKLRHQAVPCFFPWSPKSEKKTSKKLEKKEGEKSSPGKDKGHKSQKTISRYALERSLEYLSGEIPVESSHGPDSLRYCNHDSTRVMLSTSTPNAVLAEMRSATLEHRWAEVAAMLPSLFNARGTQQNTWRAALQVFCHHPNSSADHLKAFLKTCLHSNSSSEKILRTIFCTGTPEAADSECGDSIEEPSELLAPEDETTQ